MYYTPQEKASIAWMDKGCAVWYYILKNQFQRELWLYTKILIDRWHGGGSHKTTNTAVSQFCRQYCDVSIDMNEQLIRNIAAASFSTHTYLPQHLR